MVRARPERAVCYSFGIAMLATDETPEQRELSAQKIIMHSNNVKDL